MRSISGQNTLLIAFIVGILAVSTFRSLSFTPTISEALNGVDDWNRYAKQGLDIKNNGIFITSISKSYNGPGGFLYNYFVALCFTLFGNRLAPIYFLQTLMLGLSVALTYWSFERFMAIRTQYLFLAALFMFAIVDVFHYYSHILLSESLGLFLFSSFIYTFLRSTRFSHSGMLHLSTVFISLATLVRPNLLPTLALYLCIILFYRHRHDPKFARSVIAHILIVVSAISLIPMRNYFWAGTLDLFPTEGTVDSNIQLLRSAPSYFFKKLLFCFGYTKPLYAQYNIRVHWLFMWLGYFILLILRLKKARTLQVSQIGIHLFVLCYLFVSVMFVSVQSYGYRSMLLINFVVLGLSFIGFDLLILGSQTSRRKNEHLY